MFTKCMLRVSWTGCVMLLLPSPVRAQVSERPASIIAERLGNRELANVARRGYEETYPAWEAGISTIDELFLWSARWMKADVAASETPQEKISAVLNQLERLEKLQRKTRPTNFATIEYHKLEAELLLAGLDARAAAWFERQSRERSQLQGVWQVISAEENGKPTDTKEFDSIAIRGRAAKLGGSHAMISLDPFSEPKQIKAFGFNEDYFYGFHGIYQLSDGVLTLCWESQSVQRPETFSSTGGDRRCLYTFRRVKDRATIND